MNKFKFVVLLTTLTFLSSCGNSRCPKCEGTGDIIEEYYTTEEYQVPKTHSVNEDCYRCDGTGRQTCTYKRSFSGFAGSTYYECRKGKYRVLGADNAFGGANAGRTCESCSGKGYDTCSKCSGSGTLRSNKTTYIKKEREVTKERTIKDPYCSGTGFVSNFSEAFK